MESSKNLQVFKNGIEKVRLTFKPSPIEKTQSSGHSELQIEPSDKISAIVHDSMCHHGDFQRLVYYLRNKDEITLASYRSYMHNIQEKCVLDKMNDRDNIDKFIASSKCVEPDFQQVLCLTCVIDWCSIASYFMKRLLHETRRNVLVLQIVQKSLAIQYRNLELTDNIDKSLEAQPFDASDRYALPCYHVPQKHIIQDSSNKKSNNISRNEISKDITTFEMKTRVMKKTTDMKQMTIMRIERLMKKDTIKNSCFECVL